MLGKFLATTLKRSEYAEWDRLVDASPQGCIFCKSWWLDSVASGDFSIIGALKNDQLVGGIPLVHKKYKIRNGYGMPPLTQTLGILLLDSDLPYSKKISEEKRIIECLVEALDDPDFFSQNFHYNFANWLPFMWQGYSQTTRYTYVLEDIKDEDAVWLGLAKNIKNDIKKARKNNLEIACDGFSLEDFWSVYSKTFARQGMAVPHSFELFVRLDDQLVQRAKRKILYTVDPAGTVHAVIYLVVDNGYAYYLLGGADPDLRNSGATSFALYEGIKQVSAEADFFDFEGSVVRNIETFFRAFGGYQRPYFQIRRERNVYQKMKRKLKVMVQSNP